MGIFSNKDKKDGKYKFKREQLKAIKELQKENKEGLPDKKYKRYVNDIMNLDK